MKLKSAFIILFIYLSFLSFSQKASKTSDEYFKIANEFFDKNDYENAILYFDSTISIKSEHSEAYAFRGVCEYELKRYKSAIDDFDLALILESTYAEVYFFRGLTFIELGENTKACEDWTTAYSLGLKKAMKLIINNCELDTDNEKSK
ncbi:MAG: hypothetical protein AUJ98_06580 [Bacteroidetes bacterium CG2_30_33_31]|nr:MAG: hypothetical protein AUJ98_06580 [Bacteroidetes bacterium CG2_30_33_31]